MNLIKRKSLHREFADRMRERRRLRRLRAETTSAYLAASAEVRAAPRREPELAMSYRAPDVKDGVGWRIEDEKGDVVEYAKSRDKARARAKKMTEESVQNAVDTAPLSFTLEDAMAKRGYEYAGEQGTIERRWRRVS
jgi:hypothetical protein